MSSFECADCLQTLGSKNALHNHMKDVHDSYLCVTCYKCFNGKKSLDQHKVSKHNTQRGTSRTKKENHDHPPPHANIEGYWVKRVKFDGIKSFGRFSCKRCRKKWGSAHAYRQYKQGCQKCEQLTLPCCLWKNTGNPSDRTDSDDDGPHDSARCEACRAGVCKRGMRP